MAVCGAESVSNSFIGHLYSMLRVKTFPGADIRGNKCHPMSLGYTLYMGLLWDRYEVDMGQV